MTDQGVSVRLPAVVAVRIWAGALWRVALAALLGVLTWQAYNLRHAPAWVQVQLQREGDATRQAAKDAIAREGDATRTAAQQAIRDSLKPVLAEVKDWRADTNSQVAGLRADVMARVDSIQGALLAPKDSLRADVLARVDKGVDGLERAATGISAQVQPLVNPVQNTLNVISENADLLGNCDHNVDCLANRLIPAMKAGERAAGSVERMAKAVEKETPETAKAFRKTSQSMAVIADRLARPVSWIRGVLTTAAKAAFKFIGF